LARDSPSKMVRLAEADLYASLAAPGTKACDAVGGAFRPEWRDRPVRTKSSSTLSCGLAALQRACVHQAYTGEMVPNTSLLRFQSLSDSPGNATPSFGFRFELVPSRLGQAVVFRAAVIFGVSPEGGDPALFFHSVQRGKQRAWFNNKCPACDLLDSARDSQAVHLASDKRFQNQHIQSPLQKCCRFRIQEISPIDSL
jgi:hypothetical protein